VTSLVEEQRSEPLLSFLRIYARHRNHRPTLLIFCYTHGLESEPYSRNTSTTSNSPSVLPPRSRSSFTAIAFIWSFSFPSLPVDSDDILDDDLDSNQLRTETEPRHSLFYTLETGCSFKHISVKLKHFKIISSTSGLGHSLRFEDRLGPDQSLKKSSILAGLALAIFSSPIKKDRGEREHQHSINRWRPLENPEQPFSSYLFFFQR
jgi:hypothetical protein